MLRTIREGQGATLRDFAKEIGRSTSFLCRIENGALSRIRIEDVPRVCEGYGISVFQLFEIAEVQLSTTHMKPERIQSGLTASKDSPEPTTTHMKPERIQSGLTTPEDSQHAE